MKMFVENLTHIDFSYLHAERGLLGESWAVDLVLEGRLDDQGMICDFSTVKKRVKQWLDAEVDHRLVVANELPRLAVEQGGGEIVINWRYPDEAEFICQGPLQAVTLVDGASITPETLARWCESRLLELFPEVEGISLAFHAEQIDGAYYHYSHGLQKHGGNCQRIAHGHRSRLLVYRNGERDQATEQQWAEVLRDIYIGSRQHLQVDATETQYHFAYDAIQGHFELTLPASRCHMMDTETTVEQIAQHLCSEIAQQSAADDQIEVRAFEGIGKGAIAEH